MKRKEPVIAKGQEKLIDPAHRPTRIRGQDRRMAGPIVVVSGALICVFGWFLYDLQAVREADADRPSVLQSGAKVAERLMQGFEAGEVPAKPEATLPAAPPALDHLPVIPGKPPLVNQLPPVPTDPGVLPPVPDHSRDGVTPVVSTRTLDDKRLERLEAALQSPTRVELRREETEHAAAGPAGVVQRLTDLKDSMAQGREGYLEKLRQVREAGALGSQSAPTTSDPDAAYARFAGDGADRWRWEHRLQAAAPYQLHAGTVVPAVLQTPIHSQLPGPIAALVSQDVRDTATGRHVLIPQGSRLLGSYGADVQSGQERLLVAWQRLTLPDGRTLELGAMPGTDGAGQVGLHDQVDTHFWQQLRTAVLMSGVTAGVGLSQGGLAAQPNESTIGSVMAQSLGQQLGQLSEEMLRKQMNVSPTLEIRAGYRLNVDVTKDLVFEGPYAPSYPGGSRR